MSIAVDSFVKMEEPTIKQTQPRNIAHTALLIFLCCDRPGSKQTAPIHESSAQACNRECAWTAAQVQAFDAMHADLLLKIVGVVQVPKKDVHLTLLPNSKVPNGIADVLQVVLRVLVQHQRLHMLAHQLW